jgi:hypothetical protein
MVKGDPENIKVRVFPGSRSIGGGSNFEIIPDI